MMWPSHGLFTREPTHASRPKDARDQRQFCNVGADVGCFRRFQADHVEHQSGAVVGAAGIEGRLDQRARAIFGRDALAHDVGDGFRREIPVHAIAAEQEAVVLRHRLTGVVEPHLGLDAKRAGEDVRPAGTGRPNVVGGQQVQAIAAEPIGAGVADMQHMRDASAQHQRREGASHSRQAEIAGALRMDPAIECVQHNSGRAPHFHGLGQIAKSIEETAHRDLRRLAAALGAANSVCDGRHQIPARLRQLRPENGAGEILIALARPGLRGEADTYLDAGKALSHRRRSNRIMISPATLDGDALAEPRSGIAAAILKPATMIDEIAAGARCDDYRQFLRFAVERVVAAVGCVVPRNLRVADAGRVGIHRTLVVVDLDLPIRAAREVGAGDRGLAARGFGADGRSRDQDHQCANCRRQPG